MSGLFGTNGIRGVVNEDLTVELILKLGKAIGSYYSGTVAVAVDTRVSSEMIKNALSSGIMSTGCDVMDLGILPVPALQYYVRTHDNIVGGVMITASHNTPEFNGLKCVDAEGNELDDEGERAIESNIGEEPRNTAIGTMMDDITATESYIDSLLEHINVNEIRKKNMKVVIDCANGASSIAMPLFFQKLGVVAVTINASPGGKFPGRNSEPTEENLTDMISIMAVVSADLGVALDIDGDRAVFITDHARFINGDKGLAILARYMLKKNKGKIVTPMSTSHILEEVVKEAGGEMEYSGVGSKKVSKKMKEVSAVFGGEENGGMMFPDVEYCRDPMFAVGKMLESIISEGSLDDQLDSLPKYYMVKRSVDCPNEKKDAVMAFFKENNASRISAELDGIKLDYNDGWVFIRASGTEEKIRIYCESKSERTSSKRSDKYCAAAEKFIST